jgi:hypothetical protein
VIGGAVVGGGIGAALSASAQAALKEIFKKDNIALSSAGCYAGPPWPFRRELTPLKITGGSTFREGPGKDQVEVIGGRLRIDTQSPPAAYGHFELQTGTALPPTDSNYRFLLAHNRDLFAIKTGSTASGKTEIHILTEPSGYKTFSVQTATALQQTDQHWDFGIASNRDVFAISKNNTGSGTTEIHVLSAASNYQKFVTQTKTALPPSDGTWTFAVADNRDVFAIKKSATGSNTTELHILAASKNYRVFVVQTKTALHTTDDKWAFGVAANRDVFAFMKNGTASGTTELHVLAASGGYQGFALQTKTALHEVDQTWALCVAANRDIFAIKKNGGASNSTEIHVMR